MVRVFTGADQEDVETGDLTQDGDRRPADADPLTSLSSQLEHRTEEQEEETGDSRQQAPLLMVGQQAPRILGPRDQVLLDRWRQVSQEQRR